MRVPVCAAECGPWTEADHLDAVHGVGVVQHGRLQGAASVAGVGIAVSGLAHVQPGADLTSCIDTHLDQDNDEQDDDSPTDTQGEVQPRLLLVLCGQVEP